MHSFACYTCYDAIRCYDATKLGNIAYLEQAASSMQAFGRETARPGGTGMSMSNRRQGAGGRRQAIGRWGAKFDRKKGSSGVAIRYPYVCIL
jgi:hypothetical protein